MNPENYKDILVELHEDGVVLATLNRPEDLNPPMGRVHTELSRLAPDFDADPRAKVMVLTATGRAFMAGRPDAVMGPEGRGGLLGWVENAAPEWSADAVQIEGRRIVDGILECRKPIICAVNGYAMGLGANVALLCDIVIAARSAVFAETHVTTGVGAGDGGQLIWPLLMGVNRAKYYLMTGDRLTADEAERLGLVNFVTDDDKLMDKAMELAGRLARGPLQAIIASKVPINTWMRSLSAQILPLSIAMENLSAKTADAEEAMKAIMEKRAPNFTGQA